MILDKEEYRAFLLELISKVQFPGQALDFAYEVKQAILHAEVKEGS